MKMNWKFWTTLGVATVLILLCMFLPDDVLLASLVSSLAIPAAIMAVAWIYRKPFEQKLTDLLNVTLPGGGGMNFKDHTTELQKKNTSLQKQETVPTGDDERIVKEKLYKNALLRLCLYTLIMADRFAKHKLTEDIDYALGQFKYTFDDFKKNFPADKDLLYLTEQYQAYQADFNWPDLDAIPSLKK